MTEETLNRIGPFILLIVAGGAMWLGRHKLTRFGDWAHQLDPERDKAGVLGSTVQRVVSDPDGVWWEVNGGPFVRPTTRSEVAVTMPVLMLRHAFVIVVFIVSLPVWAVAVVPVTAVGIIRGTGYGPRFVYVVAWGVQAVDAALSRRIGRHLTRGAPHPWPWVDPPRDLDLTYLFHIFI